MTRLVAALLLGAGATMAAAAQAATTEGADARLRTAIDAMLAEPFEATSPAGLRTASYLLARRFNRGVDDVDGYVYLLKLLCGQALRLAEQHPETAADYREAAVVLTYNLAADTWPGWGPGQVGPITQAHRRLGLAAARRNVALASELGQPPNRRRNGYWILGAQLLADGDTAAAADAFAESRDLAADANNEAGRLMAQGWLHVAAVLAGSNEERADLAAVAAALREQGKEGRFYADQYQTALDVWAARQPTTHRRHRRCSSRSHGSRRRTAGDGNPGPWRRWARPNAHGRRPTFAPIAQALESPSGAGVRSRP